MSPTTSEVRLRLARRALAGAESLPVEARAQLFEDVATILPPKESEHAWETAFSLRQALKHQADFLELLK